MAPQTDLWLEARQKTAEMSKSYVPPFIRTFSQSLPGMPTRMSFAANLLGREKAGLVIDLNKYRPNRDLQRYVDAGADAFILRMGGPTQWVEEDYRYEEDKTWRPYMAAADKIGFGSRVAGYWIDNPFEDWNLEGIISNVHLNLINTWTNNGYMPPAFICDHEIAHTWRGATKIQVTNYNLVKSMAETTQKVWNQWRKPVSIYTANWFINQYGKLEHTTYFDNINAGEKRRGIWLAWVPQNFTKEYENLEVSLDELLTPTGDQISRFLNIGNNSKADLWQYTFSLKLPGDSVGVDASVSLGTKEEMFYMMGFKAPVVDPDPEPEPEPGDPTLADLLKRVEALEAFRQNVNEA